ncbi:two-component sensor histidine kinase [Paenibacillus sp. JCM 10914]|nr:two-component sensor histidine kinase [Paenibacillus sp. JCM 10914]
MLVILLCVSSVYYVKVTEQIQEKVGVIAKKNISQTIGLFEVMLKGYDSITKSLNSNTELIQMLKSIKSSEQMEKINYERSITNALGAILYSRTDIAAIHVITHEGRMYSYEKKLGAVIRDSFNSEGHKTVTESTGEIRWLGLYPHSFISDDRDSSVFVFGRQLFELNTLKPIGIVLVETDADVVEEAMTNASIGTGSRVLIRDQDKVMFEIGDDASQLNVNSEELQLDWSSGDDHEPVQLIDSKQYMIAAGLIKAADWEIVTITPNQDLQLELLDTQRFLWTVIIILIIIAILLSTMIAKSFSLPFKQLIHQMKQVELGNFKGQVQVKSYSEINILVGSFNRMVTHIEELIERSKNASISEKNAQLRALQAQVNPHFLYNTMDMIYWMLDEKGNDRLGNIILSLSRMFQYNSDWNNNSTSSLREELEQLKHYLIVIETRLANRVQTEVVIDPQWLDIKLPKLIIQPLVENAIKYGLEPLNRRGKLHIYTTRDNQILTIHIEDDGKGIGHERVSEIKHLLSMNVNTSIEFEKSMRMGIGLKNVHDRIRLMYGDEYGIDIQSRPNEGTVVMIYIPIIKSGENHDDEYFGGR